MRTITAILDGVLAGVNTYYALSPDTTKAQKCVSATFALLFVVAMLSNIFR